MPRGRLRRRLPKSHRSRSWSSRPSSSGSSVRQLRCIASDVRQRRCPNRSAGTRSMRLWKRASTVRRALDAVVEEGGGPASCIAL